MDLIPESDHGGNSSTGDDRLPEVTSVQAGSLTSHDRGTRHRNWHIRRVHWWARGIVGVVGVVGVGVAVVVGAGHTIGGTIVGSTITGNILLPLPLPRLPVLVVRTMPRSPSIKEAIGGRGVRGVRGHISKGETVLVGKRLPVGRAGGRLAVGAGREEGEVLRSLWRVSVEVRVGERDGSDRVAVGSGTRGRDREGSAGRAVLDLSVGDLDYGGSSASGNT